MSLVSINRYALKRLVIAMTIAAVAFLPAAAAQESGSETSEARIQALESRIAELEAALRRVTGSGPSSAAIEELRRQIDLLASEIEKLRIGPSSNDRPLEAGMVFHFPMTLRVKGEYGVGQSRTVIVTETGAEVLSDLPLGLYRIQ